MGRINNISVTVLRSRGCCGEGDNVVIVVDDNYDDDVVDDDDDDDDDDDLLISSDRVLVLDLVVNVSRSTAGDGGL